MADWVGTLVGASIPGALAAYTLRRQVRFERALRTEQTERQRHADIGISVSSVAQDQHRYPALNITNKGPAAASTINYEILPNQKYPDSMPSPFDREGWPLPTLDPGTGAQVLLNPFWGGPSYIDVRVSWEDDAGRQEKTRRLHLSD